MFEEIAFDKNFIPEKNYSPCRALKNNPMAIFIQIAGI